jgi:hypothetical protein
MAAVAFLVGCDDGSDVRTLRIAVGDAGCTPTEFAVDPGQRLRLLVENDSEAVFTISDPHGGFEDLLIEGGGKEEAFLVASASAGTYVLQCERDGGDVTEIRLVSVDAANLTPVSNPTPEPGQPETLAVSLADFTVNPSGTSLAPGSYNIIATNVSRTEEHELNVLSLQPDGSFSPVASIPAIPPQEGGAVLVNLSPGTYRLACQIEIGEAGSEVDHYQQGMWADILVESN